MPTSSPGDLSLPIYWKTYRKKIEAARHWNQSPGSPIVIDAPSNTIYAYDKHITHITPYLPDKPMAQLSAYDLLFAINKSHVKPNGDFYAESTMKTRLSVINDIYKFANENAHAFNVMRIFATSSGPKYLALMDKPPAVRRQQAIEALNRQRTKLKSLTAAQQETLVSTILEHIHEDGRFLGLAILLYTGVRPSECRGLIWADVIPFTDHPHRHMLNVCRQAEPDGSIKGTLKTPSGYRKIGIHFELAQIIQMRLEHLESQCFTFDDIADFPLCCLGNHFGTPCRDTELAKLATDTIKTSNELLEGCAFAMMASEDFTASTSAEDTHVTTYLLRHNFWTWLQSSTELNANEKRYYMGHAIFQGKENLRLPFNSDDRLWPMLVKYDHSIKHRGLHRALLCYIMGSQPLALINQGHCQITIPPELLERGGTLQVIVAGQIDRSSIQMRTLSPVKGVYTKGNPLTITTQSTPQTLEGGARNHVNCDYAHLLALYGGKIPLL